MQAEKLTHLTGKALIRLDYINQQLSIQVSISHSWAALAWTHGMGLATRLGYLDSAAWLETGLLGWARHRNLNKVHKFISARRRWSLYIAHQLVPVVIA